MSDERISLQNGAKCIRLAEMLGQMLAELRDVREDENLRRVLVDVHRRAQSEVETAVPDALDPELHRLAFVPSDTASVRELRIAQAQLVGWLEGLMGSMRLSQALRPAVEPPGADRAEQ